MRLFGLIGYPLSHSFSQKFFEEKFKKENITDAVYQNFPIRSIQDIDELVQAHENLCGLNVTAPYKEVIIPYLDAVEASAEQIGAVNVVKIDRSRGKARLIGYNTDFFGFQTSLQKQIAPEIKSALILGTGGAAKAVAFALKNLGITYRYVSGSKKDALLYKDVTKKDVQGNLLIVNATPVGMFPDVHQKPDISYEYISEKHHLFDLIYNPPETLFLQAGKQVRARVQNGLEMLHLQAEKAWDIFQL